MGHIQLLEYIRHTWRPGRHLSSPFRPPGFASRGRRADADFAGDSDDLIRSGRTACGWATKASSSVDRAAHNMEGTSACCRR